MDDVPEDVFEETLEEVFEEVVPDELTELFEVFEELSEPFDEDEPPEASELSEPLDLELFDDFVEEPDFDEDELLCELRELPEPEFELFLSEPPLSPHETIDAVRTKQAVEIASICLIFSKFIQITV